MRGGCLALMALVGVSCATARPASAPAPAAQAAAPAAATTPVEPAPLPPGPAEAGAVLWEIPAPELGTQRLFRLRYAGPDGEGSLRLTLRIAAPDRYRVSTVDLTGRALWSLSVEGAEGLWLDHRAERFCRFVGPLGLASLPLSPFPLPAIPSLLLGRVPAAAQGPVERAGGRLDFRDEAGRRWSVEAPAGEVASWTLWEQAEPSVWWRRQEGESILSQRGRGVQIRWREVLREGLEALPPPPEVPASYAEACGREFDSPGRNPYD